MAVYTLLVDGVAWPVRRGSLQLTRRVNVRPTLELEVLSLTGATPPDEGATVALVEDGATIYAGRIQQPSTGGVDDRPITPTSSRLSCVDLQARADEQFLMTAFAGGTLKAFLQWVIAGYLGANGTTLDPGQADGPTLPAIAYTYRSNKRVSDGLTDACAMAVGWAWSIGPTNVLTAQGPTATPAAVSFACCTASLCHCAQAACPSVTICVLASFPAPAIASKGCCIS